MRKLLNTLYITNEQAYLSLDGENIVCLQDDKPAFRIPFANVESIYCFNYIGCSPAFMGKCVEYQVSLCFLTPTGRFLAKVVGETKGNVLLRKKQLEVFEKAQISLVQNNIASKIYNHIFLIKRTLRDNPLTDSDQRISDVLAQLSGAIGNVFEQTDIDVLRGIEGNAAKTYFSIFNRLILQQKDDFIINGREKRPPTDKVNAVLSFLYTIYTNDYASALETVGLDSYIGFYHTMRPGRCSLACDLIEETRAIIDRFVLTMINLKIINKDDFDEQLSSAVFLNDDGRKKVLTFWQDKKREIIVHPLLKEKMPRGLIPFVQATLLAKYIRGELEEYCPFICK